MVDYYFNNTDDQYLFRLTSTFGWDECISFCEELIRDIEVAVAKSESKKSIRKGGGGRRIRLVNDERNSDDDDDDDDDNDTSTTTSSDSITILENDDSEEYPNCYYFNDSLGYLDLDERAYNNDDDHQHHVTTNSDDDSSNNNSSNNNNNGGDSNEQLTFTRKQNNSNHHHRHRHNHNISPLVRKYFHRAYTQLYYTDQWGNTPLHAASYVKPPLRVIEKLFRLGRVIWRLSSDLDVYNRVHKPYPKQNRDRLSEPNNNQTRTVPIWARLCKDRSTPFHVACSTGASTSVLHCYLDEMKYYTEQRWISPNPNNYSYCKMTVLLPDNQGNNPIVGYMACHPRDTTIESNNSGWPRVISLVERWNYAMRMLHFATMELTDDKSHSSTSMSSSVLTALENKENEMSSITLVRRCAFIASHCPLSLLEWIVSPPFHHTMDGEANKYSGLVENHTEWFPGDVCASTKDAEGKLPFHHALEVGIACPSDTDFFIKYEKKNGCVSERRMMAASKTSLSKSPPKEFSHYIDMYPQQERNRLQILQKLLRWYPCAVRTALPNGRSPLMHAIALGGAWHTRNSTRTNKHECDLNEHFGLLQLLWSHSPEQSLEIDPISGLYPFMLAATIGLPEGLSSQRERLGHDLKVMENVFHLLRKDPQLISAGTSQVIEL